MSIELIEKLMKENSKLHNAIKEHHLQHADDLCWMDNNKLYEAAGLPTKDHTVGDKFEMLKNCVRYLDKGCQAGGGWKSYAEMEKELAETKARLAVAGQLLINFPGHISEDSWYNWIACKNDFLGKDAEDAKAKTAARKKIQKQILDWLKIMGFKAWKQNSGAMPSEYKGVTRFVRFNTQDGLSDIGGWVPAKKMGLKGIATSIPLYIEVKRPGNKPSPLQAYFLECVNKDGGIGFVAESVDDVITGLTQRGVNIDG